MKIYILLFSFLLLAPVTGLAQLPINNISDQVVVIGTPSPSVGNNINIDALVKLETDFATQAGTTINNLITKKSSQGLSLTAVVPLSYSTPAPKIAGNIPVRSGMIVGAVLVFSHLPEPPK